MLNSLFISATPFDFSYFNSMYEYCIHNTYNNYVDGSVMPPPINFGFVTVRFLYLT